MEEAEFFDASVGSVHGLRLRDGRRVVVKVHGPRASVEFLRAVCTVQEHLFECGFPAAQPLEGPAPLGAGMAVVEALIDSGEHANAHESCIRRAMAASLARLVELARPFTHLPGLVTAVYDWASLSVMREPRMVGSVAHGFTTNWEEDDWRQFPSAPEALAFIADYEEGRGAAFSSEEQAVARAALVYTMAYTARCEHSDALTDMGTSAPRGAVGPPAPAGTARAFLAENASDLLGAAVGDVPAVG